MGEEAAPVGSVVETVEQLSELYRAPSRVAAAKKTVVLDEATAGFVASSPFALIGTVGADGALDVSPRGGPPGFVRILDERHVAIPDLNGNNLIDSIRAVVATLGLWSDELRRPTTAIVVRTDEVFMHCAKAFRRGRVWDPQSWDGLADVPDGLDVLHAQGLLETNDDETRALLERSYASDLAADQPG